MASGEDTTIEIFSSECVEIYFNAHVTSEWLEQRMSALVFINELYTIAYKTILYNLFNDIVKYFLEGKILTKCP